MPDSLKRRVQGFAFVGLLAGLAVFELVKAWIAGDLMSNEERKRVREDIANRARGEEPSPDA